MTALSERIARAVSKSIPGTVPCRNMIVVGRISHFVRCFFFERTPYAKTFYLWSSVVPLFNPMKSISLNYGNRLALQQDGQFFVEIPENLDMFGEVLATQLANRHLERLLQLNSVEEFLGMFPFDESNQRPSMLLDYGVANCLAGRFEVGVRLLERVSCSPFVDPFSTQVKKLAADRVGDLARGEAVFLNAVASCECENLTAHFPGCS